MHLRHLFAVAAATAFALIAPGSASAAACDVPLTDPSGVTWTPDDFGMVNADVNTIDEGDVYFDFAFYTSFQVASNSCTYEDGDREVVYGETEPPGDTGLPAGVTFTRKVFVPATGVGFARQLNILRNTTGTQHVVDFYLFGDADNYPEIDVLSTSSGDTEGTSADSWLVGARGAGAAQPADRIGAMIWQGDDVRRLRGATHLYDFDTVAGDSDPGDDVPPAPFVDGHKEPVAAFEDIVLAPGETAIILDAFATRQTQADAEAAARTLAGGDPALFAGMSDDEIRSVRNFLPTDADRDGAANASDNCLRVPNGDQADADKDGLGNACDEDDDGDGLSDAVEASLGLSGTSADSDGDGKNDPVDACPKTASAAGDGCPVQLIAGPTRVVGPTRIAPRGVTARASSRRRGSRLTVTTSGRLALPAGLTAAQACDFGILTITVKAGSRTISTRYVEMKKDCTFRSSAVFRGRSRFRRARQLDVTARFNGNAFLLRRVASRQRVPVR